MWSISLVASSNLDSISEEENRFERESDSQGGSDLGSPASACRVLF